MGARGVAALVLLLLASVLLPGAASSRVLEGEASSGKGAHVPTVAAGGSSKTESQKESGQSAAAGQHAESKSQEGAPPPTTTAVKDSKQPATGEAEEKGHEAGGAQTQTSATSPTPSPSVQEKEVQKGNPPEGSGPNGGDEAKGGMDHEETGKKGKDDATEKLKEVMEKCGASHKCSDGGNFSACLQVSDNGAIGSFVVLLNKGQNGITVNVKEALNISIDEMDVPLAKGSYRQMSIRNINPNGKLTLNGGNGDCILYVSQPSWQQQFQQVAAGLNPIYGAYLFGFTIVLVGVVFLCCKFAIRRGSGGFPYQQLEMSAPAPNSLGADNTTSTADGWDEGWDDDWDDEEAPARPSEKIPPSSISANGLSLRSRTDSKDGWDVDWND